VRHVETGITGKLIGWNASDGDIISGMIVVRFPNKPVLVVLVTLVYVLAVAVAVHAVAPSMGNAGMTSIAMRRGAPS
jgi:hypothetical protein